jgi:hypothetical protein
MAIVDIPHKYIQVIDCHNTVIVNHCPFAKKEEATTLKIDDDFYLVPSTGEVKKYNKSEVKTDNLHSLRKSFNRLKTVINCNYDDPASIRFITLTYAENMTDNKRLSRDLEHFWRNMKRRYGQFEYIYVKEKQQRGAWHIHAILFFPGKAPFMENSEASHPLRDAWGHGFVNVRAFRSDINNLGNYLCAYLTDDFQNSKKGARLENYESGIRLFNCSKGVKRPEVKEVTYEDYLALCSSPELLLVSESDTVIDIGADEKTFSLTRQIFAKDPKFSSSKS